MRFFGFGRRKEADIPAVDVAQRILSKEDVDFTSEAQVLKSSLEVVKGFLDGYSLTKKQGPEGICAIVRDKLDGALEETPLGFINLSLRKSEVTLFFQISLAMAAISEIERIQKGFTQEVENGIHEIIGAFSGREGVVG